MRFRKSVSRNAHKHDGHHRSKNTESLPKTCFSSDDARPLRQTLQRDFYRKSIQYSINTPFGQTVMPENRKTVLLETLEKYRHVTVNDNMRFIVEIFSKLECEVLNDWFRSDAPTDLVRWTDDLVSLVPDRLYRALRIDEPGGTSAG